MKRWLERPVLAIGLLAAAACEPGVGTSCDTNEAVCLNGSTQLVCEDGKYIATPCRGPGGCAVLPTVGVACDISKNKPGDACAKTEEGVATCVGDHRMIVCRSQKYLHEPCRGADGCQNDSGRAHCDKSVAVVGDPCQGDAKACDAKQKTLLTCRDSKMALLYGCLGPEGCQAKGKLNCDMSVAEQGDSCDAEMDGASACTLDGRAIVSCKGGKFVKDERCKDNERCDPKLGIKCKKPEAVEGS